jgi:pSer/pThr/pTyr-binding forkhead associated (FHA) protein
VAERIDGVLEKPSPTVHLHSFDESAITYELRAWIEDIAHEPRIASNVRTEIWEEFRRLNITIPFPIRTLEIEPRARQLELVRPATGEGLANTVLTARLFVTQGPDHGRNLALGELPATVGRAKHCDLSLNVPQASKEHFRVEWQTDHYLLTDLGSSFGTFVNGEKTTKQVLRDLDRIKVGDCVIVFENHAT